MIRVLNIVDTISSGGVERRRLSLAKCLDPGRFELKIICTNAVGPFPAEFSKYGVEVIAIGDLSSVFDVTQHRKVMAIIDGFRPHIIHGAVFEGVTMAAVSGFWKRVPVVILEETSDPQNRSWRGDLLLKLLCLAADRVVGVSPASVTYLTGRLGLSSAKVQLINNGVARPTYATKADCAVLRERLGLAADAIVMGSVGRMLSDATKRFSDLIRAFALLVAEGHNVRLVLVGEGPELPRYRNLAAELGVASHVVFTGYQNDTSAFYGIFDVFSLVSSHESFGLVLAEAMLHRLPIVATRVGGMQYIVEDGKTGFLVPKYDVAAIAEKLRLLCADAGLRAELGHNGYDRADLHYTEERYVDQVRTLYESLYEQKVTKSSRL